ncbi:MAG: hypothetical protein ACK4SY_09430 [Pyrobaculum sp.]
MIDLLIISIVVIASWYLAASWVGRWYNSKAAQRCLCQTLRKFGDAASLYLDLACGDLRIGIFVKRPPWDNPLNLAAFYLTRRRPFIVARFALEAPLGVMDASRAGRGERVGQFYLVNTSVPRAIARGLLKVAEEVGAWRVTLSGRLVQIMWEGTDCIKAVEGTKAIANFLKTHKVL